MGWSKQHHGNLVVRVLLIFIVIDLAASNPPWSNHGADLSNTRSAKRQMINRMTVKNLKLKWTFVAGKDISATPSIADGVVYFPSWNGFVYAVGALDGQLRWQLNISEATGQSNGTLSRSTPSIAGDMLIVGIYGPAMVIALDRSTGRLVWSTTLDPRPIVLITQSATIFNGEVYIGVSSLEETLPAAQCCKFRGSMAKLDVHTGEVIWQTYMAPDNGGLLDGYSGAAVWGSSPSIDIPRRLVFIATGNLYGAPPNVTECQEAQNNRTSPPAQPDQCVGPDVHFNSILALHIDTGEVAWAAQLGGYDIFYLACLEPNNPDCPPGPNVDADFGEAPMLLTVFVNGSFRDVAVAVQKSGFCWALDRYTGDIVWFKLAGPGSNTGGGIWGAATDGRTVYTNIANGDGISFNLTPATRGTTTAGAWVALDANSGEIRWATANPSNQTSNGPVTVVNDVLFAGSVAGNGPLYAMDTRSGDILWSYDTGATIYGGVSVGYGCVYVGNGYKVSLGAFHPDWTAGTSLYAFCLH